MLSHYRLVKKIGEGGMGVVWQALDTKLNRHIALKLLPAELTADPERRRRFVREARTAAAVTHPNIVTIYEIDEADGITFIAMELVEGRSLRLVIGGHPILVPEAVRIATEIAEGLARAHQDRIVHRDLKPENIIIGTNEHPRILDFGLAKLVEHQQDALRSHLSRDETRTEEMTREGKVLGTPAYMSPEQARGEIVDERSDLFSFGVTLYEMVTGRLPFLGHSQIETLAAILHKPAVPASKINALVPSRLEEILCKLLEKDPKSRYQTSQDLVVDLRRLRRDLEAESSPSYGEITGSRAVGRRRRAWTISVAAALAILSVGLAAWWVVRTLLPGRAAAVDARTILILPLEVRGQAEGAEYVGRAFAEAIAVNLSRAKGLSVLPVPEAEELETRGSQPRARAAAGAGAGRLLTGALTRDGAILRASLSLVDTARNRVVWGTHKDMTDGSLPSLAATLAAEVAAQLGTAAPRQYESFMYYTGTPAMAASPHFIEALTAIRREAGPAALGPTKALVEAFPDEPEARVLRAAALFQTAWEYPASSPLRDEFEEGLAALERVDPNSPWDDLGRASYLLRDGRYQDSLDRYTQLLARDDLTPAARSLILGLRGQSYSFLKRDDAALADLQEAVRLNPANDVAFAVLGGSLNRMGRREEGLIQARRALALNPDSFQNQWGLGYALYGLGRWEDAVKPFGKACESKPVQTWCAYHALALLRAGREQEARAAAEKAAPLPESDGGTYALAAYHAVSGDRAGALRLLRRSVDLGYFTSRRDIEDFQADRDFDTLRGTRELKALLEAAEKRLPR
jgi:eukaryotic-like serine/threonine-protein kinase